MTVGANAIEVAPDVLEMTNRDPISFVPTNGRGFSIVFDGQGPFSSATLDFGAAVTPRLPVRNGRFKYTVISAEDPGVRLDPEIIIQDPPTGGP